MPRHSKLTPEQQQEKVYESMERCGREVGLLLARAGMRETLDYLDDLKEAVRWLEKQREAS